MYYSQQGRLILHSVPTLMEIISALRPKPQMKRSSSKTEPPRDEKKEPKEMKQPIEAAEAPKKAAAKDVERDAKKSKQEEQKEEKPADEASAKSTEGSDNEGEEDDDAWFYLDNEMKPQGPFTFAQMAEWYGVGYLKPDLKVMKVGEEDFGLLSDRAEFILIPPADTPAAADGSESSAPAFEFAQTMDPNSFYYAQWLAAQQAAQQNAIPITGPVAGQYRDYEIAGSFNAATGRFQGVSSEAHFSSRGIPTDRAGRQMAMYFDIDAYQEQKRKEKEAGGGKAKPPKNWRELKERKKEQKRKNLVKGILKD